MSPTSGWLMDGVDQVVGHEGFKLVDGWWTFSEAVERRGATQDARNPCK
jgi:hypothetical protein